MTWQFSGYVPLMLAAGAISLAVAVFTLRRRFAQASVPLAVLNLAGALWAFATALQLASGSFEYAVVFHKLGFIGIDIIGVAMFAFAATYTGRTKWVTPGMLFALSLPPILTQVFVWTSDYHTLMWNALTFETRGSLVFLRESPGVWWWVDTAYSYLLLAISVGLLARMFIKEPGLYRRQASALLAAVAVPLVADAIYTYGLPGAEPVNLAPAMFAWVGLVLYWGVSRYGLLSVAPAAREYVITHMSDSVIATDTRDRVVYLNPAAERLIGQEFGSVGGRFMSQVTAGCPEILAAYGQADDSIGEVSRECEYGGRFYDGRRSILRDSRNRFRGSIFVLRDTTDRKRAEMALEEARRHLEDRVQKATADLREANVELTESRTRLAHLLSSSPAVIYCREPDGDFRVTFVGTNLESQLGYKPEQLLGDGEFWADHVHPEDRHRLETITQAVKEGEASCEYRLVSADGAERWIHDRVRLVEDGLGRPVELIGSWLDVTNRRHMEEQLSQSSKMEAVGLLAGGIAHDFNNLLTAMGGYAELIEEGLVEDDFTRRGIGEIRRAVERAAGLTRQLLAFSRKQVLRPRVINLNTVVGSTEEMFRRLIGEHIDFSTELAGDLGLVDADPGQIEQVCMNLVVNARDAMPQGGRLLVRTQNLELSLPANGHYGDVPAGSWVVLSVVDTGSGIPEDVLPHVFEPFFTTKSDGGTGLGLATVYGIAGQSGGRVTVESTVGKGTTFRLFLPRLLDPVAEDVESAPTVAEQTASSGTVLIVEDDAAVRSLLVAALRRQGFTVLEAEGAGIAMEVVSQVGPPDLLVTDVVMRLVSGPDLVAQLHKVYPSLPVLYISGYARDKLDRALDSLSEVAFLQKPFTTRELVSAVRETLRRS